MLVRIGKSFQLYVPTADWLNLNKSLELRKMSRYLELHSGERILDIACGSGYWTRKLAMAHGCTAVGIDVSARAISTARRHHNGSYCKFALSPAETLPFSGESFDKAISVCALEHFSSDTAALAEMARVLKPNGLLALSVDSFSPSFVPPAYRLWHAQKHSVRNFYDLDSIRPKLEAAGLRLLEYQYILTSRFTFLSFQLLHRHRWPVAMLLPLIYPLSRLSDKLGNRDDKGLILLLKAQKISSC
jgi:ubiquinone/menaquinone biosynthesis C-methylase UbiE